MPRYHSKHYPYIISYNKTGTVIPIFQTKELKLREVKQLARISDWATAEPQRLSVYQLCHTTSHSQGARRWGWRWQAQKRMKLTKTQGEKQNNLTGEKRRRQLNMTLKVSSLSFPQWEILSPLTGKLEKKYRKRHNEFSEGSVSTLTET